MDTPQTYRPIRLEPELEEDGQRYGWRLVVHFDPDWQHASLKLDITGGTFSVEVPDEMVHGMAIPEVAAEPQT